MTPVLRPLLAAVGFAASVAAVPALAQTGGGHGIEHSEMRRLIARSRGMAPTTCPWPAPGSPGPPGTSDSHAVGRGDDLLPADREPQRPHGDHGRHGRLHQVMDAIVRITVNQVEALPVGWKAVGGHASYRLRPDLTDQGSVDIGHRPQMQEAPPAASSAHRRGSTAEAAATRSSRALPRSTGAALLNPH